VRVFVCVCACLHRGAGQQNDCVHNCVYVCVQAFTEVLANNETWAADMTETYKMLDIDPASVQGLEDYLKVSHTHTARWCRRITDYTSK